MIEDFNGFPDGSTITTDFCIVGAGAAGITIAREFLGTRSRVLVLEAGGAGSEAATQKLYDSEVVGLPHNGIHEGRARVFGGTTTLWGGQALRFGDLDFQKRSWVPHSGWPISRAELDPYYERAERVMHLGSRFTYEQLCESFGVEPPAFDSAKLYMACSQWSPKPNFGTAYRHELKSAHNVSVLLHANVTAIALNQGGTAIENIEFRTLAGKKGTAKARFYVVCCGGIETARLLLASDGIERQGVGNRQDLVGRYFQEHFHMTYGEVLTTNRGHLQALFESFFPGGLKQAPLIVLAQHVQVERQLLDIHGTVIFEPAPDSSIAAAKTLFRALIGRDFSDAGELSRLAWTALAGPREMFSLAYRLYVQKRAGTPKRGAILLGAQGEMAPNPDSRVMLGEARDALGMRRVALDWRLGEIERRTACEYIRTLASEFERLGLGFFDLKQVASLDDPAEWVHRAHDSAHHMGTTRMHESPQFGVVDSNCQVHGISNLYIGSSSVFPTCARSNPTLTILALCLRIADRLKQMA